MPAFEVILRDASNTRGGDVAVVAVLSPEQFAEQYVEIVGP